MGHGARRAVYVALVCNVFAVGLLLKHFNETNDLDDPATPPLGSKLNGHSDGSLKSADSRSEFAPKSSGDNKVAKLKAEAQRLAEVAHNAPPEHKAQAVVDALKAADAFLEAYDGPASGWEFSTKSKQRDKMGFWKEKSPPSSKAHVAPLTSELGPGFREPSSTFKANPPPMPPVPAPPPLVAVRPTSFQICPTKDDRGLRYIPTVIKNLDGAAPHPLPKLPPKDERAPPGRTAVCFSGLLHTFSGPVANNIKKNVYSSLDNFDVFVVLPLSTRYATTEKIAEYFRPESPTHSFEVRFETEDLKMDEYHLDGFLYTNPHQQGRFLGQLKGLQNCWKVVDEHAKTTQTVYQWMMRMRPDVAYSHPIHFGPLIPDQAVVYTGYPLGYPRPEVPLCPGIDVGGDNLAFMPYDVARNYFNRLDFLRKPIAFKLKRRNPYVSDPHDVSNRWNAEDFMYRGLFALRGYVFVQHPYFPKHITCRNAVCDGWLAT